MLMFEVRTDSRETQELESLTYIEYGSRLSNYAAECFHLVLSLNQVWLLEFMKAWLDCCLIKPMPNEDYWCATDRHGEMVIRGNKDKVLIVY
jgi:hypothetical protein